MARTDDNHLVGPFSRHDAFKIDEHILAWDAIRLQVEQAGLSDLF